MHLPKLLASFSLCFAVAFVGSAVTLPAIGSWYQTLEKPFFTPPNSIFGPVWTTLYSMMAIALYFVWTAKTEKKKKQKALNVFFIQLAINLSWSLAFFGLKLPIAGLIVIIILWLLIYKSITLFHPISKPATYLLYPYLAWVTFATVLNFSIVLLNT